MSNENLTVKELEIVDLIVYRRTDIGYVCIINNQHTGVLHFNEIYRKGKGETKEAGKRTRRSGGKKKNEPTVTVSDQKTEPKEEKSAE